jgi:hypothetical protein
MDEKRHNNSVKQVGRDSFGDKDPAFVEKDIEQNAESLENFADAPDNKDSEVKAIPDSVANDTEALGSHPEAHPAAGQEQEETNNQPEYETPQSGSKDGDVPEEFEKEKRGDTEDVDDDRGGSDTADEASEKVTQADCGETDEDETVKGSPEEKEAVAERAEKQKDTGDSEDDDPAVQTQIQSETGGAEEETDDVASENAIESPAGKTSVFKVAVSAVLIAAAFSGFFLFDNKSKVKATSQKALNPPEKRELSPDLSKEKKPHKPIPSKTGNIYTAKIEEITGLRGRLLRKQEEIRGLKKQYLNGIEELEKEISDELQKGEIRTFLQAMENSAIVFTLKTIQRRQAYVQQLERPSRWIEQACEELLYLKRRTMMDMEVVEIAGGIDLNTNLRLINAAVRKYKPTADKLALDMRNAQLEPLENIWKRIQNKANPYAPVRAYSKNQIISKQICGGNFSRLSELSEISAHTASCITEMHGSDLFLNDLSEISPAAARQLFQWKGSWICLNGVRALSPRTARYLFQWDGNWISLNGLTKFPAEIGEQLLQWDGHQLELMGLQYSEDFPSTIALEYLARWELAGGKLFVPEAVRKKIDELHPEST